ncbi:MAG: hypothetical protein WCL32_22535, partial [Planctomycetota bacterium]
MKFAIRGIQSGDAHPPVVIQRSLDRHVVHVQPDREFSKRGGPILQVCRNDGWSMFDVFGVLERIDRGRMFDGRLRFVRPRIESQGQLGSCVNLSAIERLNRTY